MPLGINDVDDLKAEALIQEIESAFKERAYPGDQNIARESVGDDSCEDNWVADCFRGKRWQDIRWESILSASNLDPQAFIFFLVPEAFAYYMPALLKIALRVNEAPELAESLQFALTPDMDRNSTLWKWQQDRMKIFTHKERAVIDKAVNDITKRLD
ncbi:MAG: hypothetical protein GY703_17190 [Gammaproteobacteria bacterium]|nr:hypothetical protein [Gammaproteobacteria bacterium]